jgi:hypothetical protein
MSLDPQTGIPSILGTPLHLPAIAGGVVLTDPRNEVGFTSPRMADFSNPPDGEQVILTSRDLSTGALTQEQPQFPSERQNRLQTSFLNLNGKFAYAIVAGPPTQGGAGDYAILLQVYQRPAGTGTDFTLLGETQIDTGSQFMCPAYAFAGMMRAGTDYLVVNSTSGCHPDGISTLQLIQLSPEGDAAVQTINLVSANQDVVEGWKDNLIFAGGDLNFINNKDSFHQQLFRLVNGEARQIAECDASVRSDCPNFTSVVIGPTEKYAYGLSGTIKLIDWDETSGNMSFTDTGIATENLDKLYVDGSGHYLMVTGGKSKQIHVYKIDGPTGALTKVLGSPFLAPGTILDLAFVPQP